MQGHSAKNINGDTGWISSSFSMKAHRTVSESTDVNSLTWCNKSPSNDLTLFASLAALCHALDAEPRLGLFVGDRG